VVSRTTCGVVWASRVTQKPRHGRSHTGPVHTHGEYRRLEDSNTPFLDPRAFDRACGAHISLSAASVTTRCQSCWLAGAEDLVSCGMSRPLWAHSVNFLSLEAPDGHNARRGMATLLISGGVAILSIHVKIGLFAEMPRSRQESILR
jgi:hypothetical protein